MPAAAMSACAQRGAAEAGPGGAGASWRRLRIRVKGQRPAGGSLSGYGTCCCPRSALRRREYAPAWKKCPPEEGCCNCDACEPPFGEPCDFLRGSVLMLPAATVGAVREGQNTTAIHSGKRIHVYFK